MVIVINICSVLFSGILGVLITIFLQRRFKWYDAKYEVLLSFVENRYDIKGVEFTKAINKIYLVYFKDKNVINAVQDFQRIILDRQNSNGEAKQKLYNIYSLMCKSVRIEPMSDTLFLMPFNIKD